ncbi:MAG TPA: N-acetylmuramoyl-L-alanine amidase [Kineosporiaceae bacterium]
MTGWRRRGTALVLAAGAGLAAAACSARSDAPSASAGTSSAGTASAAASGSAAGLATAPASTSGTTPTAAASSPATTPPSAGALRGRMVAIDPGHNGGNFRHTAQIARTVDIGNGTKACDTTGTETNAGYAEAAFALDVSLRLAGLLRAEGASVVLTRTGDDGVGPCITERTAIGNQAHADAAISIHGDGAPAAGYGFHVITPRGIGRNDAIVAPSRRLAIDIRDAFRAGTGEPLSTYTGTTTGGVVARNDLGGLNLSTVPKVFIECGNMRNAADARRMTDPAWRQRAAAALAAGIADYLVGRPG